MGLVKIIFQCFVKVDEDWWMYDNIMSQEVVDMNEENEKEPGVHQHVYSSNAFNTSQVLIWFFC